MEIRNKCEKSADDDLRVRKAKGKLNPETPNSPYSSYLRLVNEVRWLLQIALLLFLLLAMLSDHPLDSSWSYQATEAHYQNWAGPVGAWVSDILLLLFGLSAYWWVVWLVQHIVFSYQKMMHTALASEIKPMVSRSDIRLILIELFSFLLLISASSGLENIRLTAFSATLPRIPGGILGTFIAEISQQALGFAGATLLLLFFLTLGLSLLFRFSWVVVAEKVGAYVIDFFVWLLAFYQQRKARARETAITRESTLEHARLFEAQEPVLVPTVPPAPIVHESLQPEQLPNKQKGEQNHSEVPPLSLLDKAHETRTLVSEDMLTFTKRLIEKKLQDFGVEVQVVAAYPGPVITRYEIEPATGVKGSQIVNLAKDLARSLSLTSIRVVETIPGKNCMGLELPNAQRAVVCLSEIFSAQVYKDATSVLTLGLGKDISGYPVVADLARMPHLLIAGTTGSGKSVGVNAMILSLLYKALPDQVKLIMIDPKMLEMSVYEGIPHLLCPVVTDMRQAARALQWVVGEMERRYRVMSRVGVRNLESYNAKIEAAQKKGELIANPFSLTPDHPEPLSVSPYIVVVIDELADLMMVVGKKIEELIARIAQKARASGIHIILATQRPSVDVITGLIKANVPTRIAFQVSSKIDSRTILDQQGAETLLGMGDMLFMPPGVAVLTRVHGAFVSDAEVHRIVDYLKQQWGAPNYTEEILEGGQTDEEDAQGAHKGYQQQEEADALYDQAVAIVLKNRRASISLVQRHLRIGYNRAARLLEQMEKSGLVSAMQTNGNREILVPSTESD